MDGLSLPPPQAPYLDAATGVWILSRYADVLPAFREPALWPVGTNGEDDGGPRDEAGTLLSRHDVQDSLSPAKLAEWQAGMEALAEETLDGLPTGRPVDLLHEFAKPWCMSTALMVAEVDPCDRGRLADLGDRVFARTGSPPDSEARPRAAEAAEEMERYFATSALPMAQQTFIGISQTLPRLLANGWLALFRSPAEVTKLRADPALMPWAVEELLRFAGIIMRLFRKAQTDVDLGQMRLAAGERVALMIGSANRDPDKFSEPDRVDVTRRATGQLALGIGRSSCAGARLIRMAHATAIGAIFRKFEQVEVVDASWHNASSFCWPTTARVILRSQK